VRRVRGLRGRLAEGVGGEVRRYLLDSDDDGHWYLMPVEVREAFNEFVYEEGAEPEGVVRLSGHPSNVTFEAPEQFGKPIKEQK
jgi:hypothetical protein